MGRIPLNDGDERALEVRLFGSTTARVGTQPINLGARKQRAVFALLALNAGSTVAFEQLESGIWGDEPPETARNAIQVYVAGIRRALGPAVTDLRTAPVGYRLDVDPRRVDVLRFQSALDRETARALTLDQLRAALDLWAAEPLQDLVDFPFTTPVIARLGEQRVAAREDLIDGELALGRHEQLIGQIERLTADEPYRERGWRQLMLALYRCGRQADALAAFQRARDLLIDDLGIEPSPALAAMERAILLQDPALDAASRTDEATAPLPSLPTATVGRGNEIDDAVATVTRERLVTITGPGGVGKTRLAIEVGRRAQTLFPDGVWFVDMSATLDRAILLADLGRAIGAPPTEDPVAGIAAHLGEWRALLILDNLEQVIEVATDLANLLRRTSSVHLLVTSRAALRVSGEHLVQVGPLDPAAATALFKARATAVSRDALPDAVASAIAAQVEGLPLAIELAAASCRAMAAEDVLRRLTHWLALPEGPRDLPARHQTLRATVRWSTELLSVEERDLLGDLSVFRAPFALEAAVGLLDEDPGVGIGLASLVDASLVAHDEQRYRMLGTIREIVRESVEPARRAALDDRHAIWIEAATTAAVDGLHGPDELKVRAKLAAMLPDVRAAVEYLVVSERHEMAASILVATAPVWFNEGRLREFASQVRRVSGGDGLTVRSRAEITTLRGIFAKLTGEESGDVEMLHAGIQGLRISAPDSVMLVNGLCHLASLEAEAGHREEAVSLADEAVAVSRRSTDAGSVAMALDLAGYVARLLGDESRALLVTQEAVAEARRSRSSQLANALAGLAGALEASGRHEEARRTAWEALATADASGSLTQQAEVATQTAAVLAHGDPPGSVSRLADALAMWLAFGAGPPAVDAGIELARMTSAADPGGTARMLGALASRSARELPPAAAPTLEALRRYLGEQDFALEYAAGSLLNDDALSRLAAGVASAMATADQSMRAPAEGIPGA